jgi:hypothetical protein
VPDVTEEGPVWSLTDCAILIVESGVITPVDLFYARSVAPNYDTTTLSFEGDDTSQEIDETNHARWTITCDKQDWDAIQRIYGKTKVLNPDADETWGMWFGDNAEEAGIAAGLRFDVKAKDESQTPNEAFIWRNTFPKGVLKMIPPTEAQWKAKRVVTLNFTASKTTTDLLGAALSGVPAGGAYGRGGRVD